MDITRNMWDSSIIKSTCKEIILTKLKLGFFGGRGATLLSILNKLMRES